MLTLTFLGTCSGTEPMPGRHHQSFVIEAGGIYYWFDAGENCAHRAYTSGIDVTRVRAVFISHIVHGKFRQTRLPVYRIVIGFV